MAISASITGWGKCVPPAVLTNEDLATLSDTSDAWVRSRTGIAERRVSHVSTSELARVACERALAAAGRSADEVDMILLASASPDTLIPCAAAALQGKLGNRDAAALDINAGCTGFVYGLSIAASLISSGQQRCILLCGAERLTWYLDFSQRDSAVLFGDGAGAVIVEASSDDGAIEAWSLGCDAEAAGSLKIPNFGTDAERWRGELETFQLQFEGREIFRRAVPGMAKECCKALEKAGVDLHDVDAVIPHQANKRIVDAVARQLGIDVPVVTNMDRYGNTSAASIPIALDEAIATDVVQPGSRLLLTAFGAGLTRGALVLRWGSRTVPLRECEAELPACELSGLQVLRQRGQIG